MLHSRPAPTPTDGPPGGLTLAADDSLRWISPQRWTPGDTAPSRSRLLAWTDQWHAIATVQATQDGQVIATRRLPWPAVPGRVFRIPFDLLSHADPAGGPVAIGLG